MKAFGAMVVLLLGSLLIYGSLDFPDWGNPASPASRHVSPYYIEHAVSDTAVPNVVTAVLADYRGYDTMFETAVIFSAGIACLFMLRVYQRATPPFRMYRHLATGVTIRIEKGGKLPEGSKEFERLDSVWVPHDLIIRTASRLVVPFAQLFALYVIAHGHHSPGGGFQGGVIFGAAVILYALSADLRSALSRAGEKIMAVLSSTGVLIYSGIGLLCFFLGSGFLDYSALARILRTDPIMARSYGIMLVEIGVGLSVMAVMVSLYYVLASAGKMDEGL